MYEANAILLSTITIADDNHRSLQSKSSAVHYRKYGRYFRTYGLYSLNRRRQTDIKILIINRRQSVDHLKPDLKMKSCTISFVHNIYHWLRILQILGKLSIVKLWDNLVF